MPGKYVRAQIPLPHKTLSGNVRISATFCFATPTDPESPDVYTRSGLDIVFRPKCAENELKPGQSDTFFSKSEYCGEEVQRKEAGKWENVLHAGKTKRGSSLDRPVFDIHYNARIGGRISSSQEKMPYALVITIEAARHVDLHDEILANFPELEAFEPSIPVTADVDIVQGSE